jgi:uncharacterized membrane protein
MHRSLPLMFRSLMYALRGGFLVRPLVIAILLGAAGAVLSSLEEHIPAIAAWLPQTLFPSHQDPQMAQAIFGGIAGSIMTVVSIVFAILLMTLTLASTQFSPRILVNFVRDRTTQWTLGLFLGTFSYCIAALPAARSQPYPFAPVATLLGAMLLALLCVGWLIFFINHISQSVSVNHIVDRIARETELVIDELMPLTRASLYRAAGPEVPAITDETAIASEASGYVRFIDTRNLVYLARSHGIRVRVLRRVGHFIPAGVALLMVSRPDRLTHDLIVQLRGAIDVGPTRTLQQDVEFGVIQIVDIGLRAISPAVNDPSTAISCVDQLSRILIRWIGRVPPAPHMYDPPHVLRVVLDWVGFEGLLDTAFEQIRHYAAGDVAVSLRLLRAYADIAGTLREPMLHDILRRRAEAVLAGCEARLPATDLARLRARAALLPVSAVTTMPEWSGAVGGADDN